MRNYYGPIKKHFEQIDKQLEAVDWTVANEENLQKVKKSISILKYWVSFGELVIQNSKIKGKLKKQLEYHLKDLKSGIEDRQILEVDLRTLRNITQSQKMMKTMPDDKKLMNYRLFLIEDSFKQMKSFKSPRIENFYNQTLEELKTLRSANNPENEIRQKQIDRREGPPINPESAFYMKNLQKFRNKILKGEIGGNIKYRESKMVLIIFSSYEFMTETKLDNIVTDVNHLLDQAWIKSQDYATKNNIIQRVQLSIDDLSFLNEKILNHIELLIKVNARNLIHDSNVIFYMHTITIIIS